MEDEEHYIRKEGAQPAWAGAGPAPTDADPLPILGEAALAADLAVKPEQQVALGQSQGAPSGQREHCSLEGSERATAAGPTTPEEMLLRWRNRQQRGLRAAAEEDSATGGSGRGNEDSATSGTGHSEDEEDTALDQRECPPEAKEEPLMRELSAKVQAIVRNSSWWEKHGFDCTLIAVAFLFLPTGFLCLRSDNALLFVTGILTLGIAYGTISVKGSHLASHGALSASRRWNKIWAAFFIEVCSGFSTELGACDHVKLHHSHTNIIGLGDSSVWKIPPLNRFVYMFLAPLALPMLSPLVALGFLRKMSWYRAARMLCFISLGLGGHCWLLLRVSGFQSMWSAVLCMLVTRAVLAVPFVHVNIFQHIGLAMFDADDRPKRILQMSHGVLNLPRNLMLDWTFGHSLISCHVEHHLFPSLSDNMCLKIKPIVSQYLMDKNLPYHEHSYFSRLQLFLSRYDDLMVHMPPITKLVGMQ